MKTFLIAVLICPLLTACGGYSVKDDGLLVDAG
jgi:hypothetical protein